MFRLSRVIFRPYKAQIQGYLSVSCTLGSQALGIPACVLTDISYTYILGKHIGITNIKKKNDIYCYHLSWSHFGSWIAHFVTFNSRSLHFNVHSQLQTTCTAFNAEYRHHVSFETLRSLVRLSIVYHLRRAVYSENSKKHVNKRHRKKFRVQELNLDYIGLRVIFQQRTEFLVYNLRENLSSDGGRYYSGRL